MACCGAGPGGINDHSYESLARRFLQLHWVGDRVEAVALTGTWVPRSCGMGPASRAGAGALVASLIGRHRGLGVVGGRVPVPP